MINVLKEYRSKQNRSLSKQKGFTLIEVMVALSILGLTSSLMLVSFLNQVRTINRNVVKSGAVIAAAFVLDEIRSRDIATLPTSGSDAPVQITRDSKDYDVTISYCLNAALCSSATKHLTASVSYKSKEVYSVETVYTDFEV